MESLSHDPSLSLLFVCLLDKMGVLLACCCKKDTNWINLLPFNSSTIKKNSMLNGIEWFGFNQVEIIDGNFNYLCTLTNTTMDFFLHRLLLKYSHEILQDLLNFPSCNLITKYRTIINHNIKWLFDVHPRYVITIIYHCVDLFLLRHSLLPNLIFIH